MEEYSLSQLDVADVVVRASDRMQYITGTYTDKDSYYYDAGPGPQPQRGDDDIATNCFIARVTARGDIQDTIYIKTLHSDWSYFFWDDEMKCNAIDIVPKTDNIIAVGYQITYQYLTYRDYWNTTITHGRDNRKRAMLFYTTSDLRLIALKNFFNGDVYTSGELEA